MRWLPCGDAAALVEVDDLDTVLRLHAAAVAARDAGDLDDVVDLVPAARTLLVRCGSRGALERTASRVRALTLPDVVPSEGEEVEVEVVYDGEDLADVADLLGCEVAEVVRRHTSTAWRVAFTGFAPGFGYLVADDGENPLDVARRGESRTSVPAGAVGLAGEFTGVYPRASPGGWQLVGTARTETWRPDDEHPALLVPGTRVRFSEVRGTTRHDEGATSRDPRRSRERGAEERGPDRGSRPGSSVHVLATGPLTTVQDLGRPGLASLGIAQSGALDPAALRLAHRLVGGDERDAGLEVTYGGLSLRASGRVVLAVTGAPVPVTVTHDGVRREHGTGVAVVLPDGAEVTLGAPTAGLRTWVAVRGGIRTETVMGSASTDLLAGLGRPLEAGDELEIGPEPDAPVPALDQAPTAAPDDGPLLLRVVPGPRDDWFTPAALDALRGPWTVEARSNRIGVRLEGPLLERTTATREAELPSEGAVAGAIQVATDGRPVLFLADHPVTGGYPVVGCVVVDDLPLAAQAVPGQEIRFRTVGGPRP